MASKIAKQEFGRRLYNLILKRGWNQSELARQSGLPRDSISVYVRGKSSPTPASLQKLATALQTTPEELYPNHTEGAIDADNPAVEFKVSSNAPHMAWLRVNQMVTTPTGIKILDLLHADGPVDESDGKRSR